MLLVMIGQFSFVPGGQLEENDALCKSAFQNIAGSLPSDAFSTGMEFETLRQFWLEDRESFVEHIFPKALSSLFVPLIETKDRIVFVRPDEKTKVVIGNLTLYRFFHYLYVYFPDETHACIYEFIPAREGK